MSHTPTPAADQVAILREVADLLVERNWRGDLTEALRDMADATERAAIQPACEAVLVDALESIRDRTAVWPAGRAKHALETHAAQQDDKAGQYPHPKCDSACYYLCTEAGAHAPSCLTAAPEGKTEASEIATWRERMKATTMTWRTSDGKSAVEFQYMQEEIADLRAALAARPPVAAPDAEAIRSVGPIEIEEGRTYIPLPGGWEIQTKGKGSTFRICHVQGKGVYQRWAVLDERLHKPLEDMALAMHAGQKET
jgi:hypothetical protein